MCITLKKDLMVLKTTISSSASTGIHSNILPLIWDFFSPNQSKEYFFHFTHGCNYLESTLTIEMCVYTVKKIIKHHRNLQKCRNYILVYKSQEFGSWQPTTRNLFFTCMKCFIYIVALLRQRAQWSSELWINIFQMSFLIGYVEVPSFVLGITTRSKSINKSSHLYTAPPKRSPLAWIKGEPRKIRDKSLSCQTDWAGHEPKALSPEVEPQTNIPFTALYVGGSRDSSSCGRGGLSTTTHCLFSDGY